MKRVLVIPFSVLCFLFILSPVLAVFSFSVSQNSINEDQEIEATVNLSLQNQGNKTYYLEGALKREGGTNYFGQTWNDTDWVGYTTTNADKSLKSITTTPEGSWSGTLKIRLDTTSSQFIGSGNYILRINRFTSSGSSSTPSDNEVVLAVTANLTPTPQPTDDPTPTPTPTSIPTPTPTKTPSPTKPPPTPTKKLSPTPSKNPELTIPPSLLGTSSAEKTSEPSSPETKVAGFQFSNILIIAGGLVLILTGGLVFSFIAKDKFPKV